MHRRSIALLASTALAVTGTVAFATPAVADPLTAWDDFAAAYEDPSVTWITLDENVSGEEALRLPGRKGLTIDLAGRTLSIALPSGPSAGLGVPSGTSLTVRDGVGGGRLDVSTTGTGAGIGGAAGEDAGAISLQSGVISARSAGAAGIGGGFDGSGGQVSVGGAQVTATGGGSWSAGVGGAGNGADVDAGTFTIVAGSVAATGGTHGAGIGGGVIIDGSINIAGGNVIAQGGSVGPGIGAALLGGGYVSVTGGNVTALGGSGAPGIGGSIGGTLSQLSIAGGSVVAAGGSNAPGIGAGPLAIGPTARVAALSDSTDPVLTLGSGGNSLFLVDGTLVIGGGVQNIPAGQTWRVDGTIENTQTMRVNGVLDSNVVNRGTIIVGASGSVTASKVTGNNFQLVADPANGDAPTTLRVFAPTLAASEQSLLAPVRPGYTFRGWATTSGTWTAETPLTGDTTVTAQWERIISPFDSRAAVQIVGELAVGSTVTADVTGDSVPTPTSYTYQWFVDVEPVAGANAETYAIRSDDVGKVLAVRAEPHLDGYDSASGEGYAIASSLIAAGAFSERAQVAITGDSVVGGTVTASVTAEATPAPDSYTYSWWIGEQKIADGASLELTLDRVRDFGLLYRDVEVRVAPVLAGYDAATGSASATSRVLPAPYTSPVKLEIRGDATVDGTLEAVIVSDASPKPDEYLFVWYGWIDGELSEPIRKGATLDLFPEALGYQVAVVAYPQLAGYDEDGGSGMAISDVIGEGTLEGELSVTIDGAPVLGDTLTAVVSDDLEPDAALTYQWYADDAPLLGQTGTTLALDLSHLGKTISVTVTAALEGYTSRTADDSASRPVSGRPAIELSTDTVNAGQSLTITGADFFDTGALTIQLRPAAIILGTVTPKADGTFSVRVTVPADTAPAQSTIALRDSRGTDVATAGLTVDAPAPYTRRATLAIDGEARVGETLTASVTADAVPTPDSYTYSWYAVIDGERSEKVASGRTFTIPAEGLGFEVEAVAVPELAGYESDTGEGSARSGIIEAGAFAGDLDVDIQGTPVFGQTLTANVTDTLEPDATVSYQWFTNGAQIPGATGPTLRLGLDQLFATISVEVTATATGYAPEKAQDALVDPVTPATFTGEFSVDLVGDPVYGQTLTAQLTDTLEPDATVTWEWFAGREPIPGATGPTLFLDESLVGAEIVVQATATAPGYLEAFAGDFTATSVAPATFTGELDVVIDGVPQVGQTLTADVTSTLEPGAEVSYQWSADGAPIIEATGKTLVLDLGLIGKTITVTVTGERTGYAPVTAEAAVALPVVGLPALQLAFDTVTAGEDVVVSGSGFLGTGELTIELRSDPVTLGTVTPNADGTFSARFTIPASTPAGQHTIAAIDAAGTDVATAALTVTAPASAGPGTGAPAGLAATGIPLEGGLLGLGGLALLALGALLVLRRRVSVEE